MQFMQEVDKEKEGKLELGMRTALVVGKKRVLDHIIGPSFLNWTLFPLCSNLFIT